MTTTRLKSCAAHCPVCRAEVRLLGRLLIGEVFGCASCGEELEVASLEPLELELFARVEAEEDERSE